MVYMYVNENFMCVDPRHFEIDDDVPEYFVMRL